MRASFEILAPGRRSVYQILERELRVGSAADAAIRIADPDVHARHLRIVETGAGHCLEVEDGGVVLVNGRPVTRCALEHGDRIRLGAVEFVYCVAGRERPADDPPAEAPAEPGIRLEIAPIRGLPGPRAGPAREARSVRPARARAAVRREARPAGAFERRRRRRAMPGWLVWCNAAIVTTAVGFVVFRSLAGRELVREPDDLIALAESQLRAGDFADALDALELADARTADGRQQARIRELRQQVERRVQRLEDGPVLDGARVAHASLREFVTRYLADGAVRPEAREFVALAEEWLDRFAEVARRWDEERPLAAQVEDWLVHYRPVAEVDSPEAAADVLFRAERRTRFRPRHWAEAVRILEHWLDGHPDAAGVETVRATAADYRERGRAWAEEELQRIDRMLARGERQRAEQALEWLCGDGALPEWRGEAAARLERLRGR